MRQCEGGVLEAQQRRVNSLRSACVFSWLEMLLIPPTRGNPLCAEPEKAADIFDVWRGHYSWRILSIRGMIGKLGTIRESSGRVQRVY